MNNHDFFNILEGTGGLPAKLKNGIWEYPPELIEKWNKQVGYLKYLAGRVNEEINKMTAIEKEQFTYTARGQVSKNDKL